LGRGELATPALFCNQDSVIENVQLSPDKEKEIKMGFILGFLMGLLSAIGVLGFLAFWLYSRSSTIGVTKFINGIAQALAHKSNSTATTVPASGWEGEDQEEQVGTELVNGAAKKAGVIKP
jgi:hypothetical protein